MDSPRRPTLCKSSERTEGEPAAGLEGAEALAAPVASIVSRPTRSPLVGEGAKGGS